MESDGNPYTPIPAWCHNGVQVRHPEHGDGVVWACGFNYAYQAWAAKVSFDEHKTGTFVWVRELVLR